MIPQKLQVSLFISNLWPALSYLGQTPLPPISSIRPPGEAISGGPMKLFQYVNHLSPVTGLASGSTYQIPRLDLPITRINDTIFVPLPVELGRACPGGCSCHFCKADGSHGYWDTLALSAAGGQRHQDRTYTVHHPALHAPHVRKEMAARGNATHPYN